MGNEKPEEVRLRELTSRYNIIPIVFWSIVGFAQVTYFCYNYVDGNFIYLAGGISLLFFFIPNSCLRLFRLGRSQSIYKKTGIRTVRKYTQDGDIVNQVVRKKLSYHSRTVGANAKVLNRNIGQSYFYEKFHLVLFVFFLAVTVFAISNNFLFWGLVIFITNVLFNVLPIFLQQYNRIRLLNIKGKYAEK